MIDLLMGCESESLGIAACLADPHNASMSTRRNASLSARQRVVLLTGASSGIGKACADLLSEAGYVVYGASRNPDRICLPPDGWTPMGVDVTDDRSVEECVEAILEAEHRIDVLINCAGIGLAGAIEETSISKATAILQTDFLGMLRTCRAVLPTMRNQGGGQILNVSSLAGRIGLPFQGLYSAAKFAVEGLSEALRIEVRPFGIHVVLIEPGDIRTPFTDNRTFVDVADSSPYAERMKRALRKAEADERAGPAPSRVARQIGRILAVKSPRARYTSGGLFQRAASHLKALLPDRWFESFLSAYYRVR